MDRRQFIPLLLIVLGVNFTGQFDDIFSADSALYAVISKTIAQNNDFVNLFVDGKDWLDKPHFPFWVCAISMKLLGFSTFAYKFPSFCFFAMGLYYTYRLADDLYTKRTAYLATLILGSAMHIIVSNNDTRAEAILLGLIMGGTYYLFRLTKKFTYKHMILASLFCGAAVMTKGIFVLIIFYSAIFGHLLLKKEYKVLLDWRWIGVFILTFICFTPELYAVYRQFDLHPEKTVFDRTQVSGLRFFIWDSQFGRFFNNGPIKGSGDKFFFLHTILWAFAPWALLGYTALIIFCKDLFKGKYVREGLTFLGFSVMFFVFSMSKFQLPHYINIILPFLSIMIAAMLDQRIEESRPVFLMNKISMLLYGILFVAVMVLIEYFFFGQLTLVGGVLIFAALLMILATFITGNGIPQKFTVFGILQACLFTLYLNAAFYPALLQYQSASQVAFFCNKNFPDAELLAFSDDWLLQYYFKNKLQKFSSTEQLLKGNQQTKTLVFADEKLKATLTDSHIPYQLVCEFEQFHITELKMKFFNHKTRENAVEKRYLLQF